MCLDFSLRTSHIFSSFRSCFFLLFSTLHAKYYLDSSVLESRDQGRNSALSCANSCGIFAFPPENSCFDFFLFIFDFIFFSILFIFHFTNFLNGNMRYENVTLQQALDQIPIVNKQNIVNLFGIVSAFDASTCEVCVYDQTRDVFRAEITISDNKTERIIDEKSYDEKDKRKRIVLKIGDIVWIQRLVISSQFTFKAKHVKDLTVSTVNFVFFSCFLIFIV